MLGAFDLLLFDPDFFVDEADVLVTSGVNAIPLSVEVFMFNFFRGETRLADGECKARFRGVLL